MADILAMLGDSKTYSDSIEITAPNGEKALLGDVRKAWTEREATLARKAGEVETKAKSIKEAQAELANVYSALQSEREALAAREAVVATKATAGPSFEENFVEASKSRIEKLEALVKTMNDNVEKVGKNQLQMADAYLNKSWDETAARLSREVPEGVTINREQLLKVAFDEGYKDKYGMPDLDKAFDKVVAPVRSEISVKEAEKRGYQRAKDEEVMRSLSPTPFRQSIVGDRTAPKTEFKNMDESFDAAAKDPAIARLLSGSVDVTN